MIPAAIALGGNLGRPERAFAAALAALVAPGDVRVVRASRLWRSAPWGRTDQPEFLNAVVLVETSLDADALLARLHALEEAAGRRRDETWGPRTLDLDLLWWGDAVRGGDEGDAAVLPHPRIAERSFVLEPLAEVAPAWRHPVTGRTAGSMLRALRASGGATACVPTADRPAGAAP